MDNIYKLNFLQVTAKQFSITFSLGLVNLKKSENSVVNSFIFRPNIHCCHITNLRHGDLPSSFQPMDVSQFRGKDLKECKKFEVISVNL